MSTRPSTADAVRVRPRAERDPVRSSPHLPPTRRGAARALHAAITTTLDQLARDQALISRSERALGECHDRLRSAAQPPEIDDGDVEPSLVGDAAPPFTHRRHGVSDRVLRSLRRDPTDRDRAEDREIESELSDAIVEDRARRLAPLTTAV